MTEEKLLTLKEAADYLRMKETELKELAESGEVSYYKIGGVYLRFKKQALDKLMRGSKAKAQKPTIPKGPAAHEEKESGRQKGIAYPFLDRVKDFWYFCDFYLISFLIILALLLFIFKYS